MIDPLNSVRDLGVIDSYIAEWGPQVRDSMEGLHQFEVLVACCGDEWGSNAVVSQDRPTTGNSQVWYGERHFTADGSTELAAEELCAADSFRVAFFLHFVDTTKPIYGAWGSLDLVEATPLSERLLQSAPYFPPF